jgi:ribosome biogenesis protein Nip4
MIDDFTGQFTSKKIEYKKINSKYFAKDEKLLQVINSIKERSARKITPIYFGELLGYEKNRKFIPSPVLLDRLSKMTAKKVFLSKEGEWLYLCSREVFGRNIEKMNVSEGIVLVQNSRDENLGFGQIIKRNNTFTIKNLFDRGDFIRREMTKR